MEPESYLHAIHQAQIALKAGDKTAARHFALLAAELSPDKEDPWLILAAVASPRASLDYLNRALQINPQSKRARLGMRWAIQRFRESEPVPQPDHQPRPLLVKGVSPENLARKRPFFLPWLLILLVLCLAFTVWVGFPFLTTRTQVDQPMAQAQSLEKATRTAFPTPTDLALVELTLEPTQTSFPPIFPTATNTLEPVLSPTPLPTNTPPPPTEEPELPTEVVLETEPVEPTRGPNGQGDLPDIEPDERWIDVDLSQQRVYAYEGSQIVESFLVSTGTSRTPTVTGKYRIYVKYRSANMSGPDYFLPDVPFVMYFYKGYGLHGTYWHSNFGTPMSHGCVNLKTKEARWLFQFASVGTLVNVHR